jgi:alpha-2-macroglobulin
MELRDQKVAFFLSSLPQGSRTLTYRLRAEIPGAFHVLPTNGYAMYAPDVRALSDERHLTIRDDQQAP